MMKTLLLLLSTSLLAFSFSCSTVKNMTPTSEIKKEKTTFPRTDAFLKDLLTQHLQFFDTLLRNNSQWRIKIIYTQIDRTRSNKPQLKHWYYNIDPAAYIYPASTVKMPAAALALQRLNELAIPGLDRNTTMITEAAAPGQTAVYNDPNSSDGRPTVANYIKKIFLVSDNDAYNRLYEFLGQEYLNTSLHRMGYDSVQLRHRLSLPLTEEQNRLTNPVRFFDTAAKLLYEKPLLRSSLPFQPRRDLMGTGYMSNRKLVPQPFDFSGKNRFSLADLHSVLQTIIFPETVPASQRFNLATEDYKFLRTCMSMMPGESRFPQYDTSYTDAYVKFLLYGGSGSIDNASVRIFNKVGDAYGFLHDVAYVVDFEKGVEFMLSASIFCASNNIINYEGNYAYNTVGFPFLKRLGEVIYNHELQRKKKRAADLKAFKLDYTDF